jgi:hypothetical protein
MVKGVEFRKKEKERRREGDREKERRREGERGIERRESTVHRRLSLRYPIRHRPLALYCIAIRPAVLCDVISVATEFMVIRHRPLALYCIAIRPVRRNAHGNGKIVATLRSVPLL